MRRTERRYFVRVGWLTLDKTMVRGDPPVLQIRTCLVGFVPARTLPKPTAMFWLLSHVPSDLANSKLATGGLATLAERVSVTDPASDQTVNKVEYDPMTLDKKVNDAVLLCPAAIVEPTPGKSADVKPEPKFDPVTLVYGLVGEVWTARPRMFTGPVPEFWSWTELCRGDIPSGRRTSLPRGTVDGDTDRYPPLTTDLPRRDNAISDVYPVAVAET
jgi:hypothetical protein